MSKSSVRGIVFGLVPSLAQCRHVALLSVLLLSVVSSLHAEDLEDAAIIARASVDSAPGRRAAATVRMQPVIFDNEIDRRVRAEARHAFARLVAAQARTEAIDATLARVRLLTVALARGEDAGDAAGFDRVQAERVAADLQADAADAAEARARAQTDLAAYFVTATDPRTLHAVSGAAGARGALPDVAVLVDRALALAHEMPGAVGTTNERGESAGRVEASRADADDRRGGLQPALSPAVTARRAEIRTRVLGLTAVVSERRSATTVLREAAASAADDLERIAHVSYENGIRTAIDLLAAHRVAVRTRLRVIDAELSLRRAEIELEEIIGEALP